MIPPYPDVLMRILNQLIADSRRAERGRVFAAASDRSLHDPRDIFFSRFSSQDRAEYAQGTLRAT